MVINMRTSIQKITAFVLAAALLVSGMELSGIAQAKAKPRLNKKKATIGVGGRVLLKLKHAKKRVVWKSTKKKVATVTQKGLVQGRKKGKAKIIAYSGGKKYICKVTVTKKGSGGSSADSSSGNDNTPGASQTASPQKTAAPTASPNAAASTVASGGLAGGNHELAAASEGLTVSADGGVYSFKLGMTAAEIESGFGAPARKDKLPQGYEAYIYYNTYASYFQVYIDNGIVVGAATMSQGFTYKDLVSHGAAAATLTSFSKLPSKYMYNDAYYYNTGSEYVTAYVDSYGTVGTGGVYALQVFSTTNGSGAQVAMDDLFMGNNISDNKGYDDATVLTDMASELYDWGSALRMAKGLLPFEKYTIDNIGNTVAQTQSDYNAKLGSSSQTGSDGKTWQTRFSDQYAVPGNQDKCYVSFELVTDACPDAFGYITWSLNGTSRTEEYTGQYYARLLLTKNSKEDIEIGPYYLCAGVSYSSAKKATFVVLDLFSLY
jgi:hypothetical protein